MTVARKLGAPRLHLRRTDSTNERAIALALAGAPHGTLVTAAEQTAGRGRQGRRWTAPAGSALLASVLLRDPPALAPLLAAVAVADAIDGVGAGGSGAGVGGRGAASEIKWPNDVLLDGRKVAGILVEGRPQEAWAVVGIGCNVAVALEDLPAELRGRAGTLGLAPEAVERLLERVLATLEGWLQATSGELLDAWRARDALRGRAVRWATGSGLAAGLDGAGRLVVERPDGGRVALESGEVHLLGG